MKITDPTKGAKNRFALSLFFLFFAIAKFLWTITRYKLTKDIHLRFVIDISSSSIFLVFAIIYVLIFAITYKRSRAIG